MLHLKTMNDERLEIPEHSLRLIMKPCDDSAGSIIMYDLGLGIQTAALSDQYGFMKKTAADACAIINGVEVRTVEPGGEGKIFFARDLIVARQELKDDPSGVKTILHVQAGPQPVRINVADTLDELDGVEPTKEGKENAEVTEPV